MNDLDQLDYYQVLELQRTATPDDVKRAFHRFAAMHHPDRHSGAHPEIKAASQRWFRRGTEAYRVLMNPDERRLYDLGLTEGRTRYDPTVPPPVAPVTVSADAPLTTNNSKAAPFLKKALEALEQGNVAAAKMNLNFVVQFDPGNAVVRAKLESL